jgi:hypothetical protein
LASIHVANSTKTATAHSIIVGAPEEKESVNGQSLPVGAVYHYGIEFGTGPNAVELGRFTAPEHRLGENMQWGHALAVVQDGNSYDGVQVGIGAPGAASGVGLVYAWRPFTSSGDFSTSGASLTAPSTGRRYGDVLAAISFGSGSNAHNGFAISAPTGIAGGRAAGFVQARINQNALTSGTWNSDRQTLEQSTTGDHLPDNL